MGALVPLLRAGPPPVATFVDTLSDELDERSFRCYVRPRRLYIPGFCCWRLKADIGTRNAITRARTSRSMQTAMWPVMVYAPIASQASFILIRPFTRSLLRSAAVTTSFVSSLSFSAHVKDTDSGHTGLHGNTPSSGPARRKENRRFVREYGQDSSPL